MLKLEEPSPRACACVGSVSCNENQALHIKCDSGVCWNWVLQGGRCVPLTVQHLGGREWAAAFSQDVRGGAILG
eukprot:3309805-Rhodomonas_salina.1